LWDYQLLPQIQKERYARCMVATKQQTTEVGKVGERAVQESKYPILENQVQGATQPIFILGIGMSIK